MRNKNNRCAQNMLRGTAFVCFSKRKKPARVRRYPCRHECSWSCPLPGNQDVTKHSWCRRGKAVGLRFLPDTDKYYPSGNTVFRNLKNDEYLNCRAEALGGLGGINWSYAWGNAQTPKKPDAFPYAVMKVRPRTCSRDEQKKRPASHEDTIFLCWFISTLEQKSL